MLLEVEKLSASYGAIQALRAVSLSVDVGELVTLIGPNGAGKTTLLRTVSGLLRPRSGHVRLDGRDITGLAAHQLVGLGICHVSEGGRSFGPLTIEENLRLGAFARKASAAELDCDLGKVFELFPILRERRDQRASTLSGGQRQMLAIARGLMSRPRMMLLDEPSQGLAPLVIDAIFDVLIDLNRGGLGILLVEQNAYVALEVARRACILEVGEVVLEGPADTLRNDPRVVDLYLGGEIGGGTLSV